MCSTSTPPGSPTTPASARSSRTASKVTEAWTTSTSRCATRSRTRASSTASRRTSRRWPWRSTPTCGPRRNLTDADIPTTWDQLTTVSQEAQGGRDHAARHRRHPRPDRRVHGRDRRLDRQQGRHTGHRRLAAEPAGAARTCRACSSRVCAVYPKQVDAGWGGEAFGKGKAAMTIEGNWIKGAMQTDYPNDQVHGEAAAGRTGRPRARCRSPSAGASRPRAKFKDQAIKFVEAMTTARTSSSSFAKAFGVMPSRQSAKAGYLQQFPNDAGVHRRRRTSPRARSTRRRWTACCPTSTASSRGSPAGDPKAILKRLQRT